MLKIAAISPHSDDAELGLGASIHEWTSAKKAEVHIFVLASGSASTATHATDQKHRRSEGRASAKHLGASVEFLNLAPDSTFNAAPRGPFVQALEEVLMSQKWDRLYIPLPSFHQDHTVTYEALIAALRPRKSLVPPRSVLAYEYPGQAWGPAPPSTGKVFHAISEESIWAKKEALRMHQTQWVADETAPMIGLDAVDALARLRGSECNSQFAEMFYLVRQINGVTRWDV